MLQFVSENILIKLPDQYGNDKVTLIVLLVLVIIVQIISDWLGFRKRRHWDENNHQYRIYHHNGHVAEWVHTKASEIKAGNIFKLQPGEPFPTDCVLIYSERSLVKVN